MRKAFINCLRERARADGRICLAIGDLGYSVVEPFALEMPDRFLNTGVAEQNMIGVATGWSLAEGKIVFVYSIGNFPTLRCLEQIRNDVCHHRANVKIVSVGGGLAYGSAGFTHHAVEDFAIMRALPGMTVAAPSDAAEAAAVTELAIRTDGPFFIRLGKNNEPAVHEFPLDLRIGEPVHYAKGAEALLCCTGTIGSEAMEAATILGRKGMSVSVLGVPFLKPLSEPSLVAALRATRTVVTVEEHNGFGGLGAIVSEVIARHGLQVRFASLHLPEFVDHIGSQSALRRMYGLDSEGIARQVADLAGGAA